MLVISELEEGGRGGGGESSGERCGEYEDGDFFSFLFIPFLSISFHSMHSSDYRALMRG